MASELIDTWEIHNRINLYLLDAVPEGALGDSAAGRGRSVGEQFAHIHNVRLMWLKSAAPDLAGRIGKIEPAEAGQASVLNKALKESGEFIAELLVRGIETGRIKGFKPHPTAFLGYLISHESHHRGQIMLTLKQSGHMVDKKTQFGIWEWGTR